VIRLAFLEEKALIGGAEVNVLNLLQYLDRTQFDPLVICPHEGPLTDRIRQGGSRVSIVPRFPLFRTSAFILGKKMFNPLATLFNFCSLFPSAWKLAKFLKSQKVDVVHTNSMLAHFYGAIAARLAGVKCLWHVQDIVSPSQGFGFVEKVFKWTGQILPSRIVAVSKSAGKVFMKESQPKLAIVYNGADLERYNPRISGRRIRNEFRIFPEEIVVGIVGRVVYWKGHREFLEAARLICAAIPNVKFLVVGDATLGSQNYYDEIKRLSVQLGLGGKVVFTAFRHDVPDVVAAMDICVHASTLPEPFGLSIVEAMASEKPVVATHGGGVPEIIEHGKTGLLVPMGDHQALAKAIMKYIEHPDMRLKIGRAAREKVVQSFSIKKFVENMSRQYTGVMAIRE
jgi:glycosyltransferase involved in cell wall biosynthesis